MLDLTAARPAAAPVRLPSWTPAAALAAGLVLAGLLAFLLGGAVLPLAAAAVGGFGLTYLAGLPLDLEERLAFGLVIGGMAVALLVWLLAMLFGFSLATVTAAAALAAAAGGATVARRRNLVAADLASARARWLSAPASPGHPWPLLAVVAVGWFYALHLLSQAYLHTGGGLSAGYVNVWGDWGAHLSYAGSFAFGHNFPPEFSIDPGNRLVYPFMADLFAAALVPFGSSLPDALVQSSGYLALAFPAVMYLAGRRLVGSRMSAALAVLIFTAGGGLGFFYWFGDLAQRGWAAVAHLPREYTLDRTPPLNFQWLNPVLAYLLPQRTTLFGFSIALIVIALLWLARDRARWAPFVFAGVIAGVTPWFHVPAYGTVVALPAFWAVVRRRRQWAGYFVPAIALGLPGLIWMWPPSAIPHTFQLGWMAMTDGHTDNPLWFWFLNLGFFIPLLLVAQFGLRVPFRFGFAPLWLWFLVPNLFLLTPWEWDNTKFFIFWAMFGSFLVGGLLAAAFRSGPARAAIAALLLASLCLSGLLDLTRALDLSQNTFQFTDASGVRAADWVRANTPADAVFLTSYDHNEPIPSLAGRRIVIGFPGWLFTYGLTDWYPKVMDVQSMLEGRPGTDALVRKYHISYVVIGPHELAPGEVLDSRNPYSANVSYWRQHARTVYSDGEYTILRIG